MKVIVYHHQLAFAPGWDLGSYTIPGNLPLPEAGVCVCVKMRGPFFFLSHPLQAAQGGRVQRNDRDSHLEGPTCPKPSFNLLVGLFLPAARSDGPIPGALGKREACCNQR